LFVGGDKLVLHGCFQDDMEPVLFGPLKMEVKYVFFLFFEHISKIGEFFWFCENVSIKIGEFFGPLKM
jgi:hypothetical protein